MRVRELMAEIERLREALPSVDEYDVQIRTETSEDGVGNLDDVALHPQQSLLILKTF